MFDNTIVRIISLAVVMVVVGLARFWVGTARLRKQGEVADADEKKESISARKWSLVAGFFYMVFMVSLAGLFL